MKKYHGVLLALSPFFVYGAISILCYIFDVIRPLFDALKDISMPSYEISILIWTATIIFFPLGIAQLQYTKGLFRLWLAPLNLLGVILSWLAALMLLLRPWEEKGFYSNFDYPIVILIYTTVVNIIYSIIYIIKKRKSN